ncbi:TetR/AcrR family transcriptional regulator C-terminal domain-containing protein [Gordonia sp. DT101]|uniref:TetR/AcrR family transcriptional regulator C-terminal domain-containing protein n=1 Tax=Gordonia sp. DT101 TaxID=3416545 RepID=UPI003CF8EAE9
MTVRYTVIGAAQGNWRSSLSDYVHTVRSDLLANRVFADLLVIRAHPISRPSKLEAQHIECALARLAAAQLPPDDACRVLSALRFHLLGSVAVARLQDRPNLAQTAIETRGHAEHVRQDRTFEFSLQSILDHASHLIDRASSPADSVR